MGRRHTPGGLRFGLGVGSVLAALLLAVAAPPEDHNPFTAPPAAEQEGR